MPELGSPAETPEEGTSFSQELGVDRIEKWNVGSFKVELLLLGSFSLSAYLM